MCNAACSIAIPESIRRILTTMAASTKPPQPYQRASMSKSLRLSEKWFRRGLWLVALVFAGFLIGLGGTVVRNLPQVEHRYTLEDFIDHNAAARAREAIRSAQSTGQSASDALEQAELKRKVAQSDYNAARETFSSWLATRHVTERAEQDSELIARTKQLEALKTTDRQALAGVE